MTHLPDERLQRLVRVADRQDLGGECRDRNLELQFTVLRVIGVVPSRVVLRGVVPSGMVLRGVVPSGVVPSGVVTSVFRMGPGD